MDEFFVLSPRSCYRFYRRWHARNFNDQYIALGRPIGLSDEAQRDAKLAKLDSVAGIALLSAVGAVAVRGSEKHRHHPAIAVAYGTANALVVDELALLLDLKNVVARRTRKRRRGHRPHRRRSHPFSGLALLAARAPDTALLPRVTSTFSD